MKTCPHCSGEIRDSVIKCTHCGRGLADAPTSPQGSAPASAVPKLRIGAAPARATTSVPATRAPAPVTVAPSPVTAPPFAPAGTPAHTARTEWSAPASALSEVSTHRAMPEVKRQWGPDMWMLWAGIAAAGAGILAFLALKEPWAHLTITAAATDTTEAVVTDVTVRASSAFVGKAGSVIAIVIAAYGVLWFFYGFQRGWSIPGILSPAIAILVTLAGLGMTLLASMVWFVWEDSMVLRATSAGLTASEMRTLLDHQPVPIVAIERLPGMVSFGGMMALALFASCLAWWAYRRRAA
jgi:hypothetical protein